MGWVTLNPTFNHLQSVESFCSSRLNSLRLVFLFLFLPSQLSVPQDDFFSNVHLQSAYNIIDKVEAQFRNTYPNTAWSSLRWRKGTWHIDNIVTNHHPSFSRVYPSSGSHFYRQVSVTQRASDILLISYHPKTISTRQSFNKYRLYLTVIQATPIASWLPQRGPRVTGIGAMTPLLL